MRASLAGYSLLSLIFHSTRLCVQQSRITPTRDERDLSSQLTPEEWTTIFGDNLPRGIDYAVIHLEKENVNGENEIPHFKNITLRANKLGKIFELNLRRNTKLVDRHFVAVIRRGNETILMPDNVASSLRCFYVSHKPHYAALDLCNGTLRGIIISDASVRYSINPLPERLNPSNSDGVPHVIFSKLPARHQPSRKRRSVFWTKRRANQQSAFTQYGRSELEPRLVTPDPLCADGVMGGPSEIPSTMARGKRHKDFPPGSEIQIETAIYVDRDLYTLMKSNFPNDTENEVLRFVLTLINAVQLLYQDPSLGWKVTFVLKRLEILHADPDGLKRSHDIDHFLGSFCRWQHGENPADDGHPLHWDHALVLTGLDLYATNKNGHFLKNVVGLAPIGGMCTTTSSCTVNEGRHFESAYVVAHEIGHNLGMRHDGPSSDNECDPSTYLMSPTLGSGKTTWSPCSKRALQQFLGSPQSACLTDASPINEFLDHNGGGALPGERFKADHQCQLKYGPASHHASSQSADEICRDLHCSKDRFTWISHPALEGTACANSKWCRGGRCVEKSALAGYAPGQVVHGGWSSWSMWSECASSCIHGVKGGVDAGSIGIMVSYRRCNNPRPENGGNICPGSHQKYKTCSYNQCDKVNKVTVTDYAEQICSRMKQLDKELTGTGVQKTTSDDAQEACLVWCREKSGGYKNRGWTFPDGNTCQMKGIRESTFCIGGFCKEFNCPNSKNGENIYLHSEEICAANSTKAKDKRGAVYGQWAPISACKSNCVTPGTSFRIVQMKRCADCRSVINLQACLRASNKEKCATTQSTLEFATTTCTLFQKKLLRLSGLGMQLEPTKEDPDRGCRVACQDESISFQFYSATGEEGWFPFGVDCSQRHSSAKSYCINGKCVEFGADNVPKLNTQLASTIFSRWKRQQNEDREKENLLTDIGKVIRIIKRGKYATNNRTVENYSLDFDNPIQIRP